MFAESAILTPFLTEVMWEYRHWQKRSVMHIQWNLFSSKRKGLGFFIQTKRSMYQKV